MSSTPAVAFDPYDQWLGIPPSEQPPDHYRLLGLARFESDPERIETAADERMSLVRKHQTGPRGTLTQPLLNELAAARNCLMSPEARSAYDDRLRQPRAAAAPMARVLALPAAASALAPPVARPVAAAPQPPPAPAAVAASPAASREPVAEQPEGMGGHDRPPASAWLFALTFLAMAGAVVLVALATYGIGRLIWSRNEVAERPIEKIPAKDVNPQESNPGEHPAGNKPEHSTQPPKNAVVVMQEGSQDVNLTPATASLSGSVKLRPTGGDELLDGWSQEGDQALWTFKLLRPGFFRLELTYAALDEAGETSMSALVDSAAVKTYSLRPTGNLTQWRTTQQTIAVTTGGQHTLALRLDGAVEGRSFVFKAARLAPIASAAGEQK